MERWYFVIALALSAPLAAGCKTPPGLQAMERELRYQEDMIYQLQDYIHTYKSHLNACRAENQSLRPTTAPAPIPSSRTPSNGNGQPMEVVPLEPEGDDNGELRPPRVELPPLSSNRLAPPAAANDVFQVVELDDDEQPVENVEPEQDVEPESTEIAAEIEEKVAPVSYQVPLDVGDPTQLEAVATLSLNPHRTAAYEQDEQPDTDGIQVWLEPRGASGSIVPARGKATIAVLDPNQPRSARPLARWQVNSADLRRFQTRNGIRLKLRWHDEIPQQPEVLVFVRMITSDGLWIYADRLVSLEGRVIDGGEPVVAARRPDKPPTVSPTAHDEPVQKSVPAATEEAPTSAGPEKKGWTASIPSKPQNPVNGADSDNAPQSEPRPGAKSEPAPAAKSEPAPTAAAEPQPAPPPTAQPKQQQQQRAPTQRQAAPKRPQQRPQWAPNR